MSGGPHAIGSVDRLQSRLHVAGGKVTGYITTPRWTINP